MSFSKLATAEGEFTVDCGSLHAGPKDQHHGDRICLWWQGRGWRAAAYPSLSERERYLVIMDDAKAIWRTRNEFVERELSRFVDDDGKRIDSGDYGFLLQKLTEQAGRYAVEKQMDEGDAEELFIRIGAILNSLQWGLIEDPYKGPTRRSFSWHHNDRLLNDIERNGTPYMLRSSIEEAVTEYLELPIRDQAMDRLLIDLLIAMELCAFGDEVFNKQSSIKRFLAQGLISKTYIGIIATEAFVLLGLAALAFFAGWQGWLGNRWSLGIAIVLAVIFLILFLRATFALPSARRIQADAVEMVTEILDEIRKVYSEMQVDGAISARRIRERAAAAAEKEVVWPPPLFALLDDIIDRTGRF